ncbi:hypothetical protein EJ05DRAFT_105121 [Pseudovirgaria hyperparasitica]|uniref:Uncharacterized protein n=1 Tax=Pseudovirgaria hyperparasitica TaxID=470096 RepID=A0A6A6W0T3_9PEZI|nr:uncharacterized protein EJ05DRAFT_105121 [Pseudovirgaria hyperparasitica]KAF2755540.1 hypothetical protein EJ05DRAFT_105121 [Pseudovirgaria hyperparasitica]
MLLPVQLHSIRETSVSGHQLKNYFLKSRSFNIRKYRPKHVAEGDTNTDPNIQINQHISPSNSSILLTSFYFDLDPTGHPHNHRPFIVIRALFREPRMLLLSVIITATRLVWAPILGISLAVGSVCSLFTSHNCSTDALCSPHCTLKTFPLINPGSALLPI